MKYINRLYIVVYSSELTSQQVRQMRWGFVYGGYNGKEERVGEIERGVGNWSENIWGNRGIPYLLIFLAIWASPVEPRPYLFSLSSMLCT
jgi:hypothetical protein